MSELKPVNNSTLARHWNVSAPYVSKLKRPVAEGGKAMPDFLTVADADVWRAVHAPPKSPQSFAQNSTEGGKKNGGVSGTTTRSDKTNATHTRAKLIDITQFIKRGEGVDFDTLMIRQAEHVPQIAFGLYELACQGGNSAEISAANKNWHESAKASAAVRSSFLELQEKTRALLPLDEVMDIVSTELQPVRQAMQKIGERFAAAANPDNPALAKQVIDAAIDKIFAQLDRTSARLEKELAAPVLSADLPPAPAPADTSEEAAS